MRKYLVIYEEAVSLLDFLIYEAISFSFLSVCTEFKHADTRINIPLNICINVGLYLNLVHKLTLFYLVSMLPSSHILYPCTLSNLVRISLIFPCQGGWAENPPREQGGGEGGILDHPLLPSPTSKFMYLWGIRMYTSLLQKLNNFPAASCHGSGLLGTCRRTRLHTK
jgi:hypothetical protein